MATAIETMTPVPTVGVMGYVFVEADAWDAGVEMKFTTAGGVVAVTVMGEVSKRVGSWTEVAVRTTVFATDGAV